MIQTTNPPLQLIRHPSHGFLLVAETEAMHHACDQIGSLMFLRLILL